MTEDQIKAIPLAQRLIAAKMKAYGWTDDYPSTHTMPMRFSKNGWASTVNKEADGNFRVQLYCVGKKEFLVKTAEAVCLQLEIQYRKQLAKLK